MSAGAATVAGIDVGGEKKGFHTVVLRKRQVAGTLSACTAAEVVAWCRALGASAVGIDAPCQWSLTGRARTCERNLARMGVTAFATPRQAIGNAHPFYRWMVNGIELYKNFVAKYRLYDGKSSLNGEPFCFETFPQAIACRLSGEKLSAKYKRADRRRVLHEAGITSDALMNIDEVDAALCALAAQYVLAGRFTSHGDAAEGFILLPLTA